MKTSAHVLVLAIIGGCTAAPVPPPAPSPPASSAMTADDARALLRRGDIALATAAYQRLEAISPTDAAIGRIAIALAVDDHRALTAELERPPEGSSVALDLMLAEAALRVDAPATVRTPLADRVCAHANTDSDLSIEAGQSCAHFNARAASTSRNECVAGCDTPVRLPLSLVGDLPVVVVSVNGNAPVPFIVDTGASTALLTKEYADSIGVVPAPNTAMSVGAAGGHQVATQLANVSFELGPVRVEGADAVILELPLSGMGGIISPQSTLRDLQVTFDLEAFELGLAPPGTGVDTEMQRWPLLLHATRPVLMGAVGDRPHLPLLLDTGARGSFLAEKLDALGTPLKRKDESQGFGAGSTKTKSWTTTERVPFDVGGLGWVVDGPSITHREPPRPLPQLEIMGTVGMDFVMGRKLIVSRSESSLWVSPTPQLAPWSEGSEARFSIERDGTSFELTETVVARTDESVTIEALMTGADPKSHFRFQMHDNWSARGSFLVSRQATAMWDVVGGEAKSAPPNELAKRYERTIPSFATEGVPSIAAISMRKGDKVLLCTELGLDAKLKAPATGPPTPRFSMIECPAEPWRTVMLTLTAGDKVLWRYRRTDIQRMD